MPRDREVTDAIRPLTSRFGVLGGMFARVLLRGDQREVADPIIEWVMIDVVDVHALGDGAAIRLPYLAMKLLFPATARRREVTARAKRVDDASE